MRKKELQVKRIMRVSGEVQFPIKIGEAACYRRGGLMMWTDRVKRILEIASDYVRLETTSYFYTIERKEVGSAVLRMVA